jgi:hypothetical protein
MSNAIANNVEKVAKPNLTLDEIDEDLIIRLLRDVSQTKAGGFNLEPNTLVQRVSSEIKSRVGNITRLPEGLYDSIKGLANRFAQIRVKVMQEDGFLPSRESAAKPVFNLADVNVKLRKTLHLEKVIGLEYQLQLVEKEVADYRAKISILEAIMTANGGQLGDKETAKMSRYGKTLEKRIKLKNHLAFELHEQKKAKNEAAAAAENEAQS